MRWFFARLVILGGNLVHSSGKQQQPRGLRRVRFFLFPGVMFGNLKSWDSQKIAQVLPSQCFNGIFCSTVQQVTLETGIFSVRKRIISRKTASNGGSQSGFGCSE